MNCIKGLIFFITLCMAASFPAFAQLITVCDNCDDSDMARKSQALQSPQ